MSKIRSIERGWKEEEQNERLRDRDRETERERERTSVSPRACSRPSVCVSSL